MLSEQKLFGHVSLDVIMYQVHVSNAIFSPKSQKHVDSKNKKYQNQGTMARETEILCDHKN